MSISAEMADIEPSMDSIRDDVIPAAHRPARAANPFSLPNLLTFGRIAAIPLIVVLLYSASGPARWIGFALFIVASVTDFFDGFLARAWQQQSLLGRMLDPIADKLLVAAVLLMLVADGTISGLSLFAALIILTREILVSGLREFLAEVRVGLPVSALSKWKTVIQMVALGFLLTGPAGPELHPMAVAVGLALLWIAALVTLYTGYDYFRTGSKHLIGEGS